MSGRISQFLSVLLERGGFTIGQVRVGSDLLLHHVKDAPADASLESFTRPEDVRKLVLLDDEGKYRPLKTAPNLRRGWLLRLESVEDLRLALDYFYPAAVGLWCAWQAGEWQPTPWRETVERQTGMYRVVGLITEEQSLELIGSTCRTGCLRRILWPYAQTAPHPDTVDPASLLSPEATGEIPLLCAEACNLLVAAGRPIVKAAQKAAAEAAAASAPPPDAA
jgi:sirohydrochlorin cobaltochelatase